MHVTVQEANELAGRVLIAGFEGTAIPDYLATASQAGALGGVVLFKRNIESGKDESWFELLGSPEQGINYNAVNELCQLDPLPTAMNVIRQQMITSIVVSSFFQSRFAPRAEDRDTAQIYLSRNLEKEIAEVSYRAAQ